MKEAGRNQDFWTCYSISFWFGLVFTALFEVLLLCTLLRICIPSLLERTVSLDSGCLLCYLLRVAKQVLSSISGATKAKRKSYPKDVELLELRK